MSGEIAFALISQIILIATRKKDKRHYNAVVSLIFHPVKFSIVTNMDACKGAIFLF